MINPNSVCICLSAEFKMGTDNQILYDWLEYVTKPRGMTLFNCRILVNIDLAHWPEKRAPNSSSERLAWMLRLRNTGSNSGNSLCLAWFYGVLLAPTVVRLRVHLTRPLERFTVYRFCHWTWLIARKKLAKYIDFARDNLTWQNFCSN